MSCALVRMWMRGVTGFRFVATFCSTQIEIKKKRKKLTKSSERELLYTCRLGETGRADKESEPE